MKQTGWPETPVTCFFCGRDVDPKTEGERFYRQVLAWERRRDKGGITVALRDPTSEYAHGDCVDARRRAGARPANSPSSPLLTTNGNKRRRGGVGELDELDRAILRLLPDEGAKQGLYVPDAVHVPALVRKLKDPTLNTTEVATRMRVMHHFGYVMIVGHRKNGKAGWQRTLKGKQAAMEPVT